MSQRLTPKAPISFRPDVYAIDFGTSNSLLAAANANEVHPPIPLDPGAADPTLLRSVLYFPERGRCSFGSRAFSDYVDNGMQGRLLRSLKRFLPSRAFTNTQIGQHTYALEDLIAAFLREMRDRANLYFGADVTQVLLGRPARFAESDDDDAFAEERLAQAARRAGFQTVLFCQEPVAAAHDFREQLAVPRLVLIADFGGGTSDYTLVRMSSAGFSRTDILATFGVSLAGDAFDGSIMRTSVAKHFGGEVQYRVPFGKNVLTMPSQLLAKLCSPAEMSFFSRNDVREFLNNVKAWSLGEPDREKIDQLLCLAEDALGFQLFELIEAGKKTLSTMPEAHFSFDYPGIQIDEMLTRAGFEAGSARTVDAILGALDETLARGGVTAKDVDIVCLTGGTAKVPRIAEALEERFGHKRLRHLQGFHSVAFGLAEHARLKLGVAQLEGPRKA
ncbi:MAG: Hsp70 family protein [Polyangiaceae bacterium]|nr:Hsp70 family protein [Polyangiaceae bacterium]